MARAGSPLVIGIGIEENFIASDVFALLPVTQSFMFLEEGDIAEIRRDRVTVYDIEGNPIERSVRASQLAASTADKGPYSHYMLKEIYEQPGVIAETLEGRIHKGDCWKRALVMKRNSCSTRRTMFILLPAAPAIMQVWWPDTGWRMPVSPAV